MDPSRIVVRVQGAGRGDTALDICENRLSARHQGDPNGVPP